MKNTFWKIWGMPLLLGLMSIAGLITALVGDDVWDVFSWLTLGIPLVIIGWFLIKKQPAAK